MPESAVAHRSTEERDGVRGEPAGAPDGAMVRRGGELDAQFNGVCRAFSGGGDTIAVDGNQFVIAGTAKLKSFDELCRLVHDGRAGCLPPGATQAAARRMISGT